MQALRLRRLGLAALAYVMTTAMVAVGWAFGALSSSAALEVAAVYLAINVGLYAAIRSGLNLRFADPNLTRFQIVAGITVVMYIAYQMEDNRDIALLGCFLVYLFGVFRLSARQFTVITLYTLAAYALVINLLMHLRPLAIHDVKREWMSWLLLAGFLPCFTTIGAQINTLRHRLRDSEARFRSLTEMSSDFYWESDTEHRLTERRSALGEWNSRNVPVFRQSTQIGQRRWEVPYLSPDEAGWVTHRTGLDAHRPFRDFEYSRVGPDGTERHLAISGDPVFDALGAFTGYRGVGTDITPRKLTQERIQRVAHHDSLTGLPNRLLFNERLNQAISLGKRGSRQFALLYLDLDKFKPVNDTLGHAVGDELLKGVAARLQRQVRASDTVARVGGDEFTVILLDIARREDAETVARKIIAALGMPFQLGSPARSVSIGISIGIAVYPGDAQDADALVTAADTAMYSAKEAGNSFLAWAA